MFCYASVKTYEETDHTFFYIYSNKTYHIDNSHDTIRTGSFESNHLTFHGGPLIGVNAQRSLFLNITGMGRIATDKEQSCLIRV